MKVAIIGAGAAGLAAAWELKSLGVSVDVFESHSKPGGCASYFRRPIPQCEGKALFDAGATVLWSFREGEFYNSLLKSWGVAITPFSTHPIHRFHIKGTFIELDSSGDETWISSLIKSFPQDKTFIQKNFSKFFKIAKTLNRILYKIPATPFLTLENIAENLKLIPELSVIAKDFLCMPRNLDRLISGCSPEFKNWVDSLCLISLQSNTKNVESLYGIAALCFFPLGAGSLSGGMASLFEVLAKQLPSDKSRIFFKEKVLKITCNKGYEIRTQNSLYSGYTHILLSTPRWNSEEFFSERLFDHSDSLSWNRIKDDLWTAVVGYLVFKDDSSLPESAFNHLVSTDKGDFYFSVSARGDTLRAPIEYRVVTASTHEKLGKWSYPEYQRKKDFTGKEHYVSQKKKWETLFLEAAQKVFSSTPIYSEIGSPKTFLSYTGRTEGFVGGIPLTKEFTFLKSPTQETLLPNVYQIGDTSFPGQSVVNCTVGALEAVRKLIRTA